MLCGVCVVWCVVVWGVWLCVRTKIILTRARVYTIIIRGLYVAGLYVTWLMFEIGQSRITHDTT